MSPARPDSAPAPATRGAHATIHDVARVAGVSVASVSRVFNGRDHVRAEMRTRVEDAAAQLGYVPHAGARSLSMARTGAIGVVLPDLHGEFFSELLRGMDREASTRRLGLLLTVLHDGRGLDTLTALRGQVDGLVVMAPELDPDVLARHMPRGLAAVFLACAPQVGSLNLRVEIARGAGDMDDPLRPARRQMRHGGGGPGAIVDAQVQAADLRRAGQKHGR